MDVLWKLVDFILHVDKHLQELIADYGSGWVYVILFAIVFCETGLVVMPLLPGDSLLFAVGTFCATGALDVTTSIMLLSVAAILGDTVNYACGHFLGPKVFQSEKSRWFKREHLERAQKFYERHGGKTIVLARFVPIVRTFAPFVAGIGRMSYPWFLAYNVVGGIVWVVVFVVAGYKFGELPFVKNNFIWVAVGIVVVSLLPLVIERSRAWLGPRPAGAPAKAEDPPARN